MLFYMEKLKNSSKKWIKDAKLRRQIKLNLNLLEGQTKLNEINDKVNDTYY